MRTDVLPPRTRLPTLYPDEAQALRELTYLGAHARYPKITPRLGWRLDHELERIARLGYAGHFLLAWDACRWAADQNILLSAREARWWTARSRTAWASPGSTRSGTGSTSTGSCRRTGSKRPDIDIDFEAARRDDVRSYLVGKYGEERVATVAAVATYNTRRDRAGGGQGDGAPADRLGLSVSPHPRRRLSGGLEKPSPSAPS